MNKELINKYIAFNGHKSISAGPETFSTFKLGNLYHDKLDDTIDNIKKDFYALKKELLTKYYVDVKHIDQCKYSINGEIVEYSPGELKKITGKVIKFASYTQRKI